MNRKRLRELVYQKYDGHCAYCGRKLAMEDMQVDHIVSRYNNGSNDLDNLNPACRMCNFRKGVYTIEQFRREIQDQAKTAKRTFGNRMSAVYGLISYTPHEIIFYFEKVNKQNNDIKKIMRQKIHFTGKNLNDVFFLPCVGAIMKEDSGEPFLVLRNGLSDGFHYAVIGDWLVEEDDGKWHVEKGDEE